MTKYLFILLAYLCGSFPTGVVIGKCFFKIDIRQHGSKNIGGTNASRILGKKAGLAVSIIDILKVFIPCSIIRYYFGMELAAIAGIAGMIGHCYPIFLNFKGGKAVASYLGVTYALNFIVGIIVTLIWKLLKHTTNYVSIASILTCFLSSFIFLYLEGLGVTFYSLLLGAFFVVYRHRTNIKALLSGTENKVNKAR